MLWVILLVPVVCAAPSGLVSWRRATGWAGVASASIVLVAGIVLAVHVVHGPAAVGYGGVLRADALSSFMVIVIGVIALLATLQGVRYLEAEIAAGRCTPRHASLYAVLIQGFLASMLLAVLAANLGVMWVAIEATTIVTTFLVGHRNTRGSLEASWKYIVICSVGIALAFLGTVLVYLASLHASGHGSGALNWTSLVAQSHYLSPGVVRLAFALIVLGFGTKVGLAPMHSWLPDAHSQAPAPVSALMSGVLLTVAFYAILRFKVIADGALGPQFARTLLVIVSLLSLVVAASLLLGQRDYKRMLAYHSVEHMGLIALGAAAGSTLAIAAVLLHILGHGIAKGVLFLASGEILLVEGTSEIKDVRSLLNRRPVLGGIFAFGLVALLGFPPFSLFVSELNMLRAEFRVGLGWAAGLSLVCMAVIFGAVMSHGREMLFGPKGSDAPALTPALVAVPLIGGLVACAFIGVSVWPLGSLLHAAAHVVAL
ncbi:MAG TPA: proton-conducting transporter membrane subunit [Acidimicrobiales bacterium]|nr:proton-conducting transporter membrane subunit [Acidimicrobiales bacterium]